MPNVEASREKELPSRDEAGQNVLQPVSDHPWPQTLAPPGKQTEQHADDYGRHNARQSFINMSEAKDNRLQQHCDNGTSRKRTYLPLQVSPKDNLLTKSRGEREEKEEYRFSVREVTWKQRIGYPPLPSQEPMN